MQGRKAAQRIAQRGGRRQGEGHVPAHPQAAAAGYAPQVPPVVLGPC